MNLTKSLVVIIFIIGIFGVGQALYEADNTQDIYNVTNKIQWNSSLFEVEENYTHNDTVTVFSHRLKNILYKSIDCFGFVMFEIGKFGIEFGFKHPEINLAGFILQLPTLIKIFMVLIALVILLKGLPIIIALCYLIYEKAREIHNKIKKKKENG